MAAAMRVQYASAPIALCRAARTLPNPPTGSGASVSAWSNSDGAVEELELTVIAGAAVTLAAGAMLVAEETHDTYPEENAAVTVTNATDIINYTAHGFFTGDGPIRFTGTLPGELSLVTEYYVIKVASGTFKVATSRALALAGTAVALGDDGSAVFVRWVTGIKSISQNASAVTVADETVTIAAHGLATGTRVQVASTTTLPTGLSALTDYYAIAVDAATLSFATTAELAAAGTAIALSGSPAGTFSVVHNAYAATSATVYSLFKELNGGEALALTANIAYRERVSHRPGVTKYHLVATLDVFAPVTAWARALRFPE